MFRRIVMLKYSLAIIRYVMCVGSRENEKKHALWIDLLSRNKKIMFGKEEKEERPQQLVTDRVVPGSTLTQNWFTEKLLGVCAQPSWADSSKNEIQLDYSPSTWATAPSPPSPTMRYLRWVTCYALRIGIRAPMYVFKIWPRASIVKMQMFIVRGESPSRYLVVLSFILA